MKKLPVLSLCLLSALGMTAQLNVVKDAERVMKTGAPYQEVLKSITPAFSDAETKDLAQTYYIPGKAAFSEYDHLLGLQQFNKLPENGELVMLHDLLDGYNHFMKALPLDSVVNEKGKVKTKYSKDIVSVIAGHYIDFNNVALKAWGIKEYQGAYDAWEIFVTLPQNPAFAGKVTAQPDTIMAEIRFNQALAAWQSDRLDLALQAFDKAKAMGYNKKQLYDYAIAVASTAKNYEAVLAYAQEALPLYGKEDPQYIGQIINYYLQKEDYDKCFGLINDAINIDPSNAQYYVVRGVLYDQTKKYDEAKTDFLKAIELNPENDQALYNYGRELCEEAYRVSDAAPTSPAEMAKYSEEKIKPLFVKAAEYLERAVSVNPDNYDALRYLENAYYNLNDEAKLQDVKSRMGK